MSATRSCPGAPRSLRDAPGLAAICGSVLPGSTAAGECDFLWNEGPVLECAPETLDKTASRPSR